MTVTINGTTGIAGINGSAATPAAQGADTNTGIFYGTDIVGVSTGGTERVRVDSSGNVGIGVTPSAWGSFKALQIGGGTYNGIASTNAYLLTAANAYFDGAAFKYTSSGAASSYTQNGGAHYWNVAGSGTAGNAISFTQAMTLDASGNVGIGTSSPSAKLTIGGGNAGTYADGMTMYKSGGNIYALYPDANDLIVRSVTGSTEVCRFTYGGNLLLNRTAGVGNNSKFEVGFNFGVSSGATFVSDTSSSHTAIFFRNTNGNVGSISTSASTTTYATSSDYRLKENIQPMQNALGIVQQLNPVTYTWKADGSNGQGFIAHELQAVVPDCVIGEKDAVDEEGNPVYQGIDTSFLVATLTKAIQEQQAQIETLTAKVAALEAK